MEVLLNEEQQRIFDFFVSQFGKRTNGHEENIKKIIVTTSSLISEMKSNGDLNAEHIMDNLAVCQDNIGILYSILDKIRPTDDKDFLKDPNSIYFILIMYAHWCESLYYIFREFISQNCNPNSVSPRDVELWLRENNQNSISLAEVKNIIKHKNKSKEAITLQDFLSIFFHKYNPYSKELFEERLNPSLRNAIAHNKIKIDRSNQLIEFYDPSKKEDSKLTFVRVIDMHDTFTMIYYCIVKELLKIIN